MTSDFETDIDERDEEETEGETALGELIEKQVDAVSEFIEDRLQRAFEEHIIDEEGKEKLLAIFGLGDEEEVEN